MSNGGFIGLLYALSEWIMRFSIINLLWVIFNIPILYIVVTSLFIEQIEVLLLFIILLAILSPILLFPATTALFASVRDWIMKNEGYGELIRSFCHYYKENYKKSLLGGTIFTGIWVVWGGDLYYFMNQNMIMVYIFIILGIILYVWTINFFAVTAHYRVKLFASLKNALFITIGSPMLMIKVIMSSGIMIYMSINIFQPLLLFFTFSITAFLSFSAFYRSYLKLVEKNMYFKISEKSSIKSGEYPI